MKNLICLVMLIASSCYYDPLAITYNGPLNPCMYDGQKQTDLVLSYHSKDKQYYLGDYLRFEDSSSIVSLELGTRMYGHSNKFRWSLTCIDTDNSTDTYMVCNKETSACLGIVDVNNYLVSTNVDRRKIRFLHIKYNKYKLQLLTDKWLNMYLSEKDNWWTVSYNSLEEKEGPTFTINKTVR